MEVLTRVMPEHLIVSSLASPNNHISSPDVCPKDSNAGSTSPRSASPAELIGLLGLLLITFVIRWVFLAGPVGSDDTRYMDAAWKLAHGQPPGVLDHAYVRGAYIVWLAAWSWAGAPGSALVVSQSVVGVLLVLAIYRLAQRLTEDWRAALVAGFCWIMFPVELTYGGIVFPDELAALLALIAGGAAITGLRAPSGSGYVSIVTAGVFTGLAISVKEPYLLLPIIFGFWALWQIRPVRPALLRVALIGLVASCTFALEYPFFRLWTGDWLYRHRALHTVYGAGGLVTREVPNWYPGLSLYYLRDVLFNPNESGLFGWLLLIAALRVLRTVKESRFIVCWSLGFFAFLQFGSTTLTRYQPLPMQPRYVHPFVILLFIPFGLWIVALSRSVHLRRLGTALFVGGIVVQGISIAEIASARGLYFDTFPRAVEQTLSMQARGAIGPVAVLKPVHDRLPPDLRQRIRSWPKIDVLTGLPAVELQQLQRARIALLMPNGVDRLQSPTVNYAELERWLLNNARAAVVEDGRTFLDRFWLSTRIALLSRRATSVPVGHLYIFDHNRITFKEPHT